MSNTMKEPRKGRGFVPVVGNDKVYTCRSPEEPDWVEMLKVLFAYEPKAGVLRRKVRVVNGGPAGSIVSSMGMGYIRVTVLGRLYSAHQIAVALKTGEWPAMWVDHINGIRSDNRWVNLRLVTPGQNSFNSGRSKRNTSGFKGVSWSNISRKWQAYITFEASRIHLGFFDCIEKAKRARAKAERKLMGKYSGIICRPNDQ